MDFILFSHFRSPVSIFLLYHITGKTYQISSFSILLWLRVHQLFQHSISNNVCRTLTLTLMALCLRKTLMLNSSNQLFQLQDMGKRTPSTSAIYETLRRSKELRESLSRPGSRMSVENIPEKLKEPVNSFLWLCSTNIFKEKYFPLIVVLLASFVCSYKGYPCSYPVNTNKSHFYFISTFSWFWFTLYTRFQQQSKIVQHKIHTSIFFYTYLTKEISPSMLDYMFYIHQYCINATAFCILSNADLNKFWHLS